GRRAGGRAILGEAELGLGAIGEAVGEARRQRQAVGQQQLDALDVGLDAVVAGGGGHLQRRARLAGRVGRDLLGSDLERWRERDVRAVGGGEGVAAAAARAVVWASVDRRGRRLA